MKHAGCNQMVMWPKRWSNVSKVVVKHVVSSRNMTWCIQIFTIPHLFSGWSVRKRWNVNNMSMCLPVAWNTAALTLSQSGLLVYPSDCLRPFFFSFFFFSRWICRTQQRAHHSVSIMSIPKSDSARGLEWIKAVSQLIGLAVIFPFVSRHSQSLPTYQRFISSLIHPSSSPCTSPIH